MVASAPNRNANCSSGDVIVVETDRSEIPRGVRPLVSLFLLHVPACIRQCIGRSPRHHRSVDSDTTKRVSVPLTFRLPLR
jgi:hypothetical protein